MNIAIRMWKTFWIKKNKKMHMSVCLGVYIFRYTVCCLCSINNNKKKETL